MTAFVVRRILQIPPMLLMISLLLFLLMNAAPGGPEEIIIGDLERYSPAIADHIREQFALDQPIHMRFLSWLGNAVRGDLGVSTTQAGGVPVAELIYERLGATLQLTLAAFILSAVVAIPLGVLSAIRRYSLLDQVSTVTAFVGICFPSFWLGIMLMLIFGIFLDLLPLSGIAGAGLRGDILSRLHHAILPTFTLAFVRIGRILRYTRSSMLEVIQEDYIRTARAKGLSERVVHYKHALRNALISVVTILGLGIPGLFGGSVMIEMVFAWPGMGRLAVSSIQRRDYMVVMGVQLLITLVVLVANFLVDVLYAFIDPRISYS